MLILVEALLPQMRPVKARGEMFGESKRSMSNAEWPHLGRSPAGNAIFARCFVISRWCAVSTWRSKSLAAQQKWLFRYGQN